MLVRAMKYYLVISAVAAFLSIAMGVYMNVHNKPVGVYCDQTVGSDRTAGIRNSETCRLDAGKILSVFGPVFVVLTLTLHLPAYFYFTMRWRRSRRPPTPIAIGARDLFAPWNAAMAEIFTFSGGYPPTAGTGWKWARILGRILAVYLVAAALFVFLAMSFMAWVNMDMNHAVDYCSYDAPEFTHNFYVGSDSCQIQYFTIFWMMGRVFVTFTLILHVPAYLYYVVFFYFHRRRGKQISANTEPT